MTKLEELNETMEMCNSLCKTFPQMKKEDIFALVEISKSLDIPVGQAFTGGIHMVPGRKPEISARMINALIRRKGHSITKDKSSDETKCILHAKRADNGDTWTSTFTMEEARRAGLLSNKSWAKYPEDMLFARCLSRLGRQLFPDVIGTCYVEGEVSQELSQHAKKEISPTPQETVKPVGTCPMDILVKAHSLLGGLPEYRQKIADFLEKRGFASLDEAPQETVEKIIERAEAILTEESSDEQDS